MYVRRECVQKSYILMYYIHVHVMYSKGKYVMCACIFKHRSLIRFPRITGYFWAERTCAVKRGLAVVDFSRKAQRKVLYKSRL